MERRVRRRSLPALLLAEKTLLQLESLEQQRAEVQAALTAALAAEGGRPSRADASTPIEASVRVAPRLLREPAEDVVGVEAAWVGPLVRSPPPPHPPSLPYKVDTPRPSLRTNWTRLAHPSVLTGHVQVTERTAALRRSLFSAADLSEAERASWLDSFKWVGSRRQPLLSEAGPKVGRDARLAPGEEPSAQHQGHWSVVLRNSPSARFAVCCEPRGAAAAPPTPPPGGAVAAVATTRGLSWRPEITSS